MRTSTTATREPLAIRLEPLRAFLAETEIRNRDRLSASDADDLEALIEHAWPGAFDRTYLLHAAAWFGIGMLIAHLVFSK